MWAAAGALLWFFAVMVKFPAAKILAATSLRKSHLLLGAALGILSGVTELGFVFFFILAYPPISLANVLLLGLGAAGTEALVLFFSAKHYGVFFIERFIAGTGHVASRGLLCLGVAYSVWWLPILALFCFSTVDGTASYGHLVKWEWDRPSVAARFYFFTFSVFLAELTLFAIIAYI